MNKKALLALLVIPSLVGCGPTTEKEDTQEPPVVESTWSNEQKKIFDDHLFSYYLPYIKNASVEYVETEDLIIVKGEEVNFDAISAYADLLAADECTKDDGPYEHTFALTRKVPYKNYQKTIEIDVFASDDQNVINTETGDGFLTVVCWDLHLNEWPSTQVDAWVNELTFGSGTKLPILEGADKYELVETSWDLNGYCFLRCIMNNDPTEEYESLLEENYTIFNESLNTAGNYFAISDNNDLLVQYEFTIYDASFGFDEFREFDILFEPFFPYDSTYIAQQLQIVAPGTTTPIPDFPGYGAEVELSDNDRYLNITIQAAYTSSILNYVYTLLNDGWNIVDEGASTYTGYSPSRDLFITIKDENGRPHISIKSHSDTYKTWPVEDVYSLVKTMNAYGTLPEFEGAMGFDIQDTKNHENVFAFVAPGQEETKIASYISKLTGLGYHQVTIEDVTYYTKNGETLLINVSKTEPGVIKIKLLSLDVNVYDVDFRDEFIAWKEEKGILDTTEIPGFMLPVAVVGATKSTKSEDSEQFIITIDIGDETSMESVSAIQNQFTSHYWEFDETASWYTYGGDIFATVTGKYGTVTIVFFTEPIEQTVLGYSRAFIKGLKLNKTIPLPQSISIPGEFTLDLDTFDTTNEKFLDIKLRYGSTSASQAAKVAIAKAFLDAGWILDYESTYAKYLLDPTETIQLYVHNGGTTLDFEMSLY